ncbi:MAG: hypothetical protein R3302_02100 [Sulfurimonadaceae bacterium]|nr:hypothetical protein [Sulfurimonadaceae bacterium]
MRNFWFGLWASWALWLTVFSVTAGMIASALITLSLFVVKGMPELSDEVWLALWEIGRFTFPIAWSIALLIGLLLSVKRLFYRCIGGFEMTLQSCDGETLIEQPGVEDTLKLWRKWFLAIIWVVAAQVIGGVLLAYLFGSGESLMGWFSIYWLYLFVLVAGLATLPLMGIRCKMVKVRKC